MWLTQVVESHKSVTSLKVWKFLLHKFCDLLINNHMHWSQKCTYVCSTCQYLFFFTRNSFERRQRKQCNCIVLQCCTMNIQQKYVTAWKIISSHITGHIWGTQYVINIKWYDKYRLWPFSTKQISRSKQTNLILNYNAFIAS